MPIFLSSGIICRLRKFFKIQTLIIYLYYISMLMKMFKKMLSAIFKQKVYFEGALSTNFYELK